MTTVTMLLTALTTIHCQGAEKLSFPTLTGAYMGQNPPGRMAKPFAPGVISRRGWEYEGTFSPDMKEFYYTMDRAEFETTSDKKFIPTIIGFREQNNTWTKFIEFPRTGEITFSPDGNRIHMAKTYRDRVGDGWSEPRRLGPMFDRRDWGIMRLAASAQGTYVFDDYKSNDVIRISTVKDGVRQEPELLGAEINTGKWTAHPFIAPDESYLIWDSEREGGYGGSDLYISFKVEDGAWGKAINMGKEVNSDKSDSYATVTADGKFMTFTREIGDGNYDIYWVDASIITRLKKQHQTQVNQDVPPKASAEEAKIMHWRMPEIGKEFWDIAELNNPFIDTAPNDLEDGITVGKLGEDKGNADKIVQLAQEIADEKHGKYDSLLIAHKDTLLFESYFRRGRVDLPHPQSSATKVYVSTVLGRAIQLGYLTMADLDKPLISFLKELDKSKLVEGAEKITLHHALTMRSGIRITEEQWDEHNKNPTSAEGQKLVQLYLEMSAPITEASQTFNYQNDPMLVMQVIEAVVPGSAKDFIKKEVMDKLGIDTYDWESDEISGLPGSSSMTSRAMLKIGILAANKGKWQGEQLIPEAYISRGTQRLLYTGDDDIFGGGEDVSRQGYGYYWWGTDLHVGDYRYEAISAQGGGGMYVLLVEELDLIIVATAHFRGDATQQIIAERILPAFIKHI